MVCAVNVVILSGDYKSKPRSLNQMQTSTLQLSKGRGGEQTLMMKDAIKKPCVNLTDVSSS